MHHAPPQGRPCAATRQVAPATRALHRSLRPTPARIPILPPRPRTRRPRRRRHHATVQSRVAAVVRHHATGAHRGVRAARGCDRRLRCCGRGAGGGAAGVGGGAAEVEPR
eukprot:scaffold2906_cov30-Phaeocystis_antarctica.AAC.1